MRDDGESNEGSAAMSGVGGACMGSRGSSERYCSRLREVLQEL